jgi:hypothetical protein
MTKIGKKIMVIRIPSIFLGVYQQIDFISLTASGADSTA